MATRFLTREQLWRRITALAKNTPRAVVAVAFCGAGSPKLLPLRRGSTLIVDASPATVRAVEAGVETRGVHEHCLHAFGSHQSLSWSLRLSCSAGGSGRNFPANSCSGRGRRDESVGSKRATGWWLFSMMISSPGANDATSSPNRDLASASSTVCMGQGCHARAVAASRGFTSWPDSARKSRDTSEPLLTKSR